MKLLKKLFILRNWLIRKIKIILEFISYFKLKILFFVINDFWVQLQVLIRFNQFSQSTNVLKHNSSTFQLTSIKNQTECKHQNV